MCLNSQLLAVCLLSEGQRLYLHWCHKVFLSTSRLCNNRNLSLRIDGVSFDRSGYQWLWFSPLWPHLFSQIYGARSGWLYFYLFRHVYYQMSFVYLYWYWSTTVTFNVLHFLLSDNGSISTLGRCSFNDSVILANSLACLPYQYER